jgi:hypothetical protein
MMALEVEESKEEEVRWELNKNGLVPEEKPDSSERSKEEAGGRQEDAAKAASSESRSELSGS